MSTRKYFPNFSDEPNSTLSKQFTYSLLLGPDNHFKYEHFLFDYKFSQILHFAD